MIDDAPLLRAEGLTRYYGRRLGCRDVNLEIHPGEVLAIVGESGSGKSTLLGLLSTELEPTAGRVSYRMRDGEMRDLAGLSEGERRLLLRTDWGFVRQHAEQGLRMAVSAGGNQCGRAADGGGPAQLCRHPRGGHRLAGPGGNPADRIDDDPRTFSGGMRQRLQIARNLVTKPRHGVHGRAHRRPRCLGAGAPSRSHPSLVADLGLAVIIVTHDLAVARLLSHRIMVMKQGFGDRAGPDGSGARRSARGLYPASRFLGACRMTAHLHTPDAARALSPRRSCRRHAAAGGGAGQGIHLAPARRHPCRWWMAPRSRFRPAAAWAAGGPSGAGKSSILKMVYGNYRTDAGAIWLADEDGAVDVAHATPAGCWTCAAAASAM